MVREREVAVLPCWCQADQRRDVIYGAVGQAWPTHGCQKWIERIAPITRMNDARSALDVRELKRQAVTART